MSASAFRSPVPALLTAFVARLKSSTGVTALATGGVYNNVPQGTLYPYVKVKFVSSIPEHTCGRWGAKTLVDVDVYSQYQGDKEAAEIIGQCTPVLHMVPFTLVGHTDLGTNWESGDFLEEVVNGVVTRHHVATFRAWTEQSST